VVGVAAVLALAVPAFAGSFAHVQHVAQSHGQGGWLSWAIAGSPEVLAVLGAVEARRRRGWRRAVVLAVLCVGVTLTVAANVATSDGSGWGLVMAGWCAVAFLLVVLVVETRPRLESPGGSPGIIPPRAQDRAGTGGRDADPAAGTGPPAAGRSAGGQDRDGTRDEPPDDGGPLPDRNAGALLAAGRLVLADLERSGTVLTRASLVEGLRARDVRVGTARASELLRTLRAQNGHGTEVPR
jgi:hypothetical protein